jgi:hypothetical protein
MKGQLVGPLEFRGMNLTESEFEFLLGRTGAIQTSIKEDPKPKVKRNTSSVILAGFKPINLVKVKSIIRFSSWIRIMSQRKKFSLVKY